MGGKLGVTFTSFEYSPTDSPYWVLGTDYTSYAVVWSCSDFGLFNTQLLWILTREREPSAEAINSAFAIIDDNNLNRNKLRATAQIRCDTTAMIPIYKYICWMSAQIKLIMTIF